MCNLRVNNSSSLWADLSLVTFRSAKDVDFLNPFRGNVKSIVFISLRGQLKNKRQEKGKAFIRKDCKLHFQSMQKEQGQRNEKPEATF